MTTYELPPEPPVGSQLRDQNHHVWERTHDGWTGINYAGRFPWSWIMARSPLTLVEPDPWPTAPLIVATTNTGRELFTRTVGGGSYESAENFLCADSEHDTLTNVVPVTVVPVAALPVLWSALEQWLAGTLRGSHEDLKRLVGAVINLRGQIDALGVDL